MKIYQPLAFLPPYHPNDSVLQLNKLDVYKVLASLTLEKLLAQMVSRIGS